MKNRLFKTKKLLALLLALILALTCVACANTLEEDDDGEGATKKVELSRGKIDGNVYENEYLGFKFTKPESWVYSTDEEIAEVLNIGAEMILGDNFSEALKNSTSIYDMMVVDPATGTNISIGYENLSKTQSIGITEEEYIEALESQLEHVSAVQIVFPDELDTVRLGNVEFTRAICTTTTSGVSMSQTYYLRKTEGYMAFVIVTIPSGYTVTRIESMFK